MPRISKRMIRGIIDFDTIQVHAAGTAGGYYDTMCGLDLNDPQLGHSVSDEPVYVGEKIDCPQCWSIFDQARKFKLSDFK